MVLYPCINGHKDKIYLLRDYEYFQNLYFSKKLKCDVCNEKGINFFIVIIVNINYVLLVKKNIKVNI